MAYTYHLLIAFFINLLMIGRSQDIDLQPAFRIVGGKPVIINRFPYQVSLQMYNRHFCGGAIISTKYVVTAAHCLEGNLRQTLSIRAGSSYRNSGGTVFSIAKIFIHPRHNPTINDFDIGILLLSQNITFGPMIRAVKLPDHNERIAVGTMCVVSGWGSTQSPTSLQNQTQLRAVQLPIVARNSCQRSYSPITITNRMICAGFRKGGKDACRADSGSPLALNGKLIGLVSWGYGCGRPNYPGVYVKVSSLRQYIKNVTGL